MKRVLSSPRRRRRLLWGTAAALLVAAAIGSFVFFPNTAPTFESPKSSGKAERLPVEAPPPRTVPLSRAAQFAALQTAKDFLKTAVLRENVAASWQLTSPSIRQGMSRKEWNTGDIPVAQFPASALREAKWRLGHSYPNDLELEVLLLPKQSRAGQGLGPITYVVDLKTAGSSTRRHWVIDDLRPYGLSQPPFSASGNTAAATEGASAKLSPYWLLIPATLLVLLAMLPFGLIFRNWRAGRQAERAYRSYRDGTP